MFVILINYKKPIDIVDQYVDAHIKFLDEGYKNNYFVVSGRKTSQTGGIIISQMKDRARLEEIIKKDPYYINQVADYEILEFTPRKYHPDFASFVV